LPLKKLARVITKVGYCPSSTGINKKLDKNRERFRRTLWKMKKRIGAKIFA